MKSKQFPINRRILLGAALTSVALPSLAYSQQGKGPNNQMPTDMRIRMTFDGRTMTATLYDNPTAQDFFSILPLDLIIKNYGPNEKLAYLPRKLTEEGSGPFGNEKPYDLCYFMPWGNLAMFYAEYKYPGLIRLGRFDEGYEALHAPGEFPLRIERIS